MAPIRPRVLGAVQDLLTEAPDQVSRPVSLQCELQETSAPELEILRELIALKLFDAGALAVVDDGNFKISAGFIDEAAARAASVDLSQSSLSTTSIEIVAADDSWIAQQRAGLTISRVGPWCIRPPWLDAPTDVAPSHDIVIDPGAAFGHGGHATTAAALSLLTRNVRSGQRLLDIGTGTGVLAIAAARLGATVVAIDSSPEAISTAQANAELNEIGPDSIRFDIGDGAGSDVKVEEMVVANVTIDVHRRIANTVQPASKIVVSGILARQFRQLGSMYDCHEATTIRSIGEWVGVELNRSSDEAAGL